MSSYLLFIQARKDIFKGKQMKEYQEKIKLEWQKLPESEKAKLEKQAMDLMQKYRYIFFCSFVNMRLSMVFV